MSIIFDKSTSTFKLDTSESSYIFGIYRENYLVHYYYGAKIPDSNVYSLMRRASFASFSALNPHIDEDQFSPDVAPFEFSTNGAGDFRISALSIKNADGNTATDVRYVSHKIYPGKPALPGLPSTYANTEDEADTLEIETVDCVTGAKVTLIYTVFNNHAVITRSVRVENTSERDFDIERIFSTCIDLPESDYNMVHLYGRWNKERSVATRHLEHGRQSIASKRGSSSHNHNPFVALTSDTGNEESGDTYGFNLVYSGNFSCEIEVDTYCSARLIMGINPEGFNWHLAPAESFQSPEVVMVFSQNGLGGMSRSFHRFYSNNLIRGEYKNKKRPLLVNSWEAAYFDFDDDKLVSFAKQAKELGIEMLVMDDGWFGKRDDDTTSLGDWYVNENKLKGGLGSLIERINALGMKFGIWYEPEMISPDSDLFRLHPDWCIHVPQRECCIARNQYVLDMSRADVRDCIFEQISSVLSKYPVDYVKWDFNRNITEAGSALLPANRQKELFHRFILGTYELMGRLTSTFPHILLENCSGGGGRFDPGMLAYSPQIWCSDNTDPIERLSIQFGTSMCYPASTMGAHVSASKRAGLRTKATVALWGTFGYELDPNKLTEDEKDEVRCEIDDYHRYYELIHKGDLYRLITPTENHFRCAWEFVSEDKSEVLLSVVTMRQAEKQTLFIRLRGLDADKMYIDDDTDEVYSGALLMNAGICLSDHLNEDGESFTKYFKQE